MKLTITKQGVEIPGTTRVSRSSTELLDKGLTAIDHFDRKGEEVTATLYDDIGNRIISFNKHGFNPLHRGSTEEPGQVNDRNKEEAKEGNH